jgi:hypothetical protein
MSRSPHRQARQPQRKHAGGDGDHPAMRMRGHAGDHGEADGQCQEEARHPHRSQRSAQVEEPRVERELLDSYVVRGELRQQLVVRGP